MASFGSSAPAVGQRLVFLPTLTAVVAQAATRGMDHLISFKLGKEGKWRPPKNPKRS